jgi:urease accessory protein
MNGASLYRLLSWLSPAFPVGSFTHSGGLEWAVGEGLVCNRQQLEDWINDLLANGCIRNEAVIFVHAWRSSARHDDSSLREIAELAAALHPSRERRAESTSQGAAFRSVASRTAGEQAFAMLTAIADEDLCYPIAVAVLAQTHEINLRDALTGYLHGVVSNLVSAAVRLIPLGQTDGQLAISFLETPVMQLSDWTFRLPETDPVEQLGGETVMADFATLAHETQYTRLFRT